MSPGGLVDPMVEDLLTPRARLLLILGLISLEAEGGQDGAEWTLLVDGQEPGQWVELWTDGDGQRRWTRYAPDPEDPSIWTSWEYDTEAEALNALAMGV